MAERITMSDAVKARLLDPDNLPATVEIAGQTLFPVRPAGSGFKSVVWEVNNQDGRPRALKFATYEDFLDRSADEERMYAARLDQDQVWFARIEASGKTCLDESIAGAPFECVYFLQDWVSGLPLDGFLMTHREDVTAHFLLWYGTTIMRPLAALASAKLAHDDLHPGNVMLTEPTASDFQESHRLKLVDMGSLKPSELVVKDKHDLDHVVDHLVLIHNIVIEDGGASRRDHRFLNELKEVFARIVDPDPERALRDPKAIYTALQEADSRSAYLSATGGRRINSPFEFISSEHIADDSTFVELFAEAPWLPKVAGRDPCLLTGPRGCGKSTLFRWLSLKTQLARAEADLAQFEIAGFYIACSVELEGRFSWIKTEEQASKHEQALIHYFNLVLLHETLETLLAMRSHEEWLRAKGVAALPWSVGSAEQAAVLEFITEGLQADAPLLAGVSGLEQAIHLVERERRRCDVAMRRGQPCRSPTPETLIGDFSALLVQVIPFFATHRVAYLVDDFTTRRVNEHVQLALNKVIRLRRDSMLFKVSSEKRGMRITDSSGAPLDVARELVEIDIGREYLDLSGSSHVGRAREFAIKLLDNRLEAAEWEGRSVTLLGNSDWGEHGALSRALRDGSGRNQYHGLQCIADLCSGDVSTLLLIYRRILEAANAQKSSKNLISKTTQHDIVRSVSSDQVALLRTHVPAGPEMHNLVQAFGTFVGNVLRNGREVKQSGTRSVPPTCPRIEVDGSAETAEQLSDELMLLFEELIRRAVFIEMEPGLGRHGNVQTLRWQLRRVFLPAFRAALDKNRPVSLKPGQFKFLLHNPKEACAGLYSRWPLSSEGRATPGQAELFPEAAE